MRPITGSALYDYTLVIILVIIGTGIATKGDKWWGWLIVAAAGYWAFQVTRGMGLI